MSHRSVSETVAADQADSGEALEGQQAIDHHLRFCDSAFYSTVLTMPHNVDMSTAEQRDLPYTALAQNVDFGYTICISGHTYLRTSSVVDMAHY